MAPVSSNSLLYTALRYDCLYFLFSAKTKDNFNNNTCRETKRGMISGKWTFLANKRFQTAAGPLASTLLCPSDPALFAVVVVLVVFVVASSAR